MKNIKRVCVVGAGAIGSLFIGHLATVVETCVLTRRQSHADDLNRLGLRVSGKSDLQSKVLASTDPAELGDVDLVIIATKATAVEASARCIEGYFPDAAVLMIQNGLGCEKTLRNFGDWPIISAVTFMSGVRHSDTHVEYELDTATWMGPWAEGGPSYEFVKDVELLLTNAGLRAEGYRDLLPHQWSKLIFNSAVNAIAAVTDLPHVKAFAEQEKIESLGNLVFDMMDEGKRIAAALGITLASDPWLMNVKAVSQGTTGEQEYAHVPSMLDDCRNKNFTEVDWITGAIAREAKRLGVAAPYHESLYRLVKGLEAGWLRSDKN